MIQVGNLNAVRDFTDVRDIVRAYWLALTQGTPGEVYNICSGRGVRIGEMLDMLVDISGARVEVQEDPSRLRPSDVPMLIGDCSKFREATGWEPETPLRQTLSDLLSFWAEQLGWKSERMAAGRT